jgi:hypothetical protein
VQRGQLDGRRREKYLVYEYTGVVAATALRGERGNVAWLPVSEILNNGHVGGVPIEPALVSWFQRNNRGQLVFDGGMSDAPAVMYAVPGSLKGRIQVVYDYSTCLERAGPGAAAERCLVALGDTGFGHHARAGHYDTLATVLPEGSTSIVVGDPRRVIGLERSTVER